MPLKTSVCDRSLDSHLEHKYKMSQTCFVRRLRNQLQCTKALYYDVYQFRTMNGLAPSLNLSSVNIAAEKYACVILLCSGGKLLRQMVLQIYLTWSHLDGHVEFLTLYQWWHIPEIQPEKVYPHQQSSFYMFPTKCQHELAPHPSVAFHHL